MGRKKRKRGKKTKGKDFEALRAEKPYVFGPGAHPRPTEQPVRRNANRASASGTDDEEKRHESDGREEVR